MNAADWSILIGWLGAALSLSVIGGVVIVVLCLLHRWGALDDDNRDQPPTLDEYYRERMRRK